jgi:tetratricopeptide (TPR) repeat protein
LTRDGATRIDLAPLDRDHSGQLIAGLLDGPPSERLRDSLFAITEGNPLFLEQSVLALREQGQIGRAGRAWHVVGDMYIGLPLVVRDVLVQRLRRLSRRCYDTVAMAAVLGQTFEYDALSAALAPESMLPLVEDLEEATQAHVLREVPAGYAFTHALLREAVYGALSLPRQLLLHGQAGEALERLAGPHAAEHAAELAHHFVRAGRAPKMSAKALFYSLEAGRRAAGLLLHHEALEHLGRVCDLIDRDGVAVTLAIHLEVLSARLAGQRELGMWPAMIATAERILELAEDPLLRARARSAIGEARQRTGDMAAAVDACDGALADLDGAPRQPETASARLTVLGDKQYLLFLQARFRDQTVVCEEMLSIAEELGTPRAIEDAHNALASAAMGRGQVDKGLAHFGACLTAALVANDRFRQALAHSNLGIQYQFAGEFEPARTHLERALELRRELGADARNVNTIQRLGWVALGEGDLEKAVELGELARDLAIRTSDRWAAECCDLLGTICTVKAEWSAAIEHFELALRLREHGPRIVGRIDTLMGLGTVHLQTGNCGRALELFASALDVANSIDPSPWLVAAQRQLGQLYYQLGEPEGPVLVRSALALGETIPRSIQFGPTLLAAVECGCWDRDLAGATRALERALTCGLTAVVRIDVLCELARLQIAAGNVGAARCRIGAAQELANRLGSPRGICRVMHTDGLVAAATGDRRAAGDSFEQAIGVARRSGLTLEVERLSYALAHLEQASGLRPWMLASVPTRTSEV